jgi:hypothetical protein
MIADQRDFVVWWDKHVDDRGGVGIRLEAAAAIMRQYGEQFRRSPRRRQAVPSSRLPLSTKLISRCVRVMSWLAIRLPLRSISPPASRKMEVDVVGNKPRSPNQHATKFQIIKQVGPSGRLQRNARFRFLAVFPDVEDRLAKRHLADAGQDSFARSDTDIHCGWIAEARSTSDKVRLTPANTGSRKAAAPIPRKKSLAST